MVDFMTSSLVKRRDLNKWSVLHLAGTTGKGRASAFTAFSQFFSATMGFSVARVSPPRTTSSLKRKPSMVVPVLVATG
jgi:hypothetical protein